MLTGRVPAETSDATLRINRERRAPSARPRERCRMRGQQRQKPQSEQRSYTGRRNTFGARIAARAFAEDGVLGQLEPYLGAMIPNLTDYAAINMACCDRP